MSMVDAIRFPGEWNLERWTNGAGEQSVSLRIPIKTGATSLEALGAIALIAMYLRDHPEKVTHEADHRDEDRNRTENA
jgi:hypothetical protein